MGLALNGAASTAPWMFGDGAGLPMMDESPVVDCDGDWLRSSSSSLMIDSEEMIGTHDVQKNPSSKFKWYLYNDNVSQTLTQNKSKQIQITNDGQQTSV
jgi:hypothetical protein